ncbi:hypothetical protein WJX84_006718 [Apatococcus fuscideae]|uniref:Uncharacterized protein n=1 Tax=Apatococcus fuscideae TaxID=2026836 RepID=A0AAW1TEU4_9CHLO
MEATCRLSVVEALAGSAERPLSLLTSLGSLKGNSLPGVEQLSYRRRKASVPAQCAASGPRGFQDGRRLHKAAADFEKSVKKQGLDPDEAIAKELGLTKASEMTKLQEKYKDKMKDRLANYQEMVNQQKALMNASFEQGKQAYSRGRYTSSVGLFKKALDEEGPFTGMGGDIQIWLALAYEACGQSKDCIDVYKMLENTHPMPAVRRQAADLRYILEAPKLQLNPDEYVKIPILENADRYQPARATTMRPRPPKQGKTVPKSREDIFWENYQPPLSLPKNRYVLVASSMLLVGLAFYSSRF